MGKGDRSTRRGKINVGSYGNIRPHRAKKAGATATAAKSPRTVSKTARKKA